MTDPSPERADSAGGWRRVKGTAQRALVIALLTCLAWWIVLYALQDIMLFPRNMTGPPGPRPPDPNIVQYQVSLDHDGKVEAWFFPSPDATPQQPGPVVVYFHGNAELIDFQKEITDGYKKLGLSMLLPEFRGYGRSDGRPSQKGIGADMQRFYDMLTARPDVDAARIVYHGRSVGGAVAADLASVRKPAAMILESTFISVVRMARRYVAPPLLIKNPYRTDLIIQRADYPLLIMHGAHDQIIPVRHGRTLRDLAPAAMVKYHEFPAGHNDFPGNDQLYWDLISSFLVTHRLISEATE